VTKLSTSITGGYVLNTITVTHVGVGAIDTLTLGSGKVWAFRHLSGNNADSVNRTPDQTTSI